MCGIFFLDFLFCSIDLSLMPILYCLYYYNFVILFEIWKCGASSFFFLSKLLWLFSVFCRSIQILWYFSISVKKEVAILDRYCNKFIDWFERYGYFNSINTSILWAWNIFPFICPLQFISSIYYHFLVYRFFMSWITFISRYFIFWYNLKSSCFLKFYPWYFGVCTASVFYF